MLIKKGFGTGDIISIKLISGEELIARWNSETDQEVEVDRPMAVTLTPSGVGMMPWLFLAETDRSYLIKKTTISAIVMAKKEAANQYVEGTTGIALTPNRA
jgi:hypothetical protein